MGSGGFSLLDHRNGLFDHRGIPLRSCKHLCEMVKGGIVVAHENMLGHTHDGRPVIREQKNKRRDIGLCRPTSDGMDSPRVGPKRKVFGRIEVLFDEGPERICPL